MLKKSKVKSATGISERGQKGSSVTLDNLHVSFPVYDEKYQKISTRKKKSTFSKSSSNVASMNNEPGKVPKDRRLTLNVPKDAAVHFGNFYGVQESANSSKSDNIQNFLESGASSYKTTPRLEFTRQMVQKLERTAGTKDYARQVAAILEETVEPPHFKMHSVPLENSIPDGRFNPTGYPLWYKDPYKMSFNSDEIYKLLKEKHDNDTKKGKYIFEEEVMEDDFNEGKDNEERNEDEENLPDIDVDHLTREEKMSLNTLSYKSSRDTEIKDTKSMENEDNSPDDGDIEN